TALNLSRLVKALPRAESPPDALAAAGTAPGCRCRLMPLNLITSQTRSGSLGTTSGFPPSAASLCSNHAECGC
ncbi:MAG: hypothetical protein NT167_28370, partial [Verrucomicrobia bacterium]|nr:hypothetical protein [Verrucomicrobiota bacterium]